MKGALPRKGRERPSVANVRHFLCRALACVSGRNTSIVRDIVDINTFSGLGSLKPEFAIGLCPETGSCPALTRALTRRKRRASVATGGGGTAIEAIAAAVGAGRHG